MEDVETVLNFAPSMTWNGKHPAVELVTGTYQKGVRLSARAMKEIKPKWHDSPSLESGLLTFTETKSPSG